MTDNTPKLTVQAFKNMGRLLELITPIHRVLGFLIAEAESSPEIADVLNRAYDYANEEVKQ